MSIVVSGAFAASGSSDGEFAVGIAFVCAGESTLAFVGTLGEAGTLPSGYEYLPVDVTAATFLPRRDPAVGITDQLGAPGALTFRNGVAVVVGQDVDCDFNDGNGSHFKGPALRVDQGYESGGQRSQSIWDVQATDYVWLLNRRRPFACYDASATTVFKALIDDWTVGFTYTGVAAGLPTVNVVFDGSETVSQCFDRVAQLIGAVWRLNTKDLAVFFDDPGPNPDDVTDSNTDLIRDPQPTLSTDISQVRNRVFGKSATANVLADVAVTDREIEVDGLDLFAAGAGDLFSGCQRFSYTGKATVSTPVPRDAGGDALTATDDNSINGNVPAGQWYYSSTFVGASGESDLSAESNVASTAQVQTGATLNGVPYEFLSGGDIDDGSHSWAIADFTADGRCAFSGPGATSTVPGGQIHFYNISLTVDPRVTSRWLMRTKALGNPNEYFFAVEMDLSDTEVFDTLADAELTGTPIPLGFNNTGSIVNLSDIPIGPPDTTARNIYRREGAETAPTLLTTISDNETTELEDNFASTGGVPFPGALSPLVRQMLTGISGLTHTILAGDPISLFLMMEDIAAQAEVATFEGGDGVHEFEVPDTSSMTNLTDMTRRLTAELTLYAPPIKTVRFGSRDRKFKAGTTVVFNLTDPPIVATLKVQTVNIDQLHESSDLKERRTVVASSVRHTLDDLLRHVLLK